MNQLRATLSERHVNMMCFSQSVGIGLFLQNGRAIHYAGPGMATLAYILSGTIIWSAASCLGEMTALFPVKGPIFELTKRFLDQSVGYATAWLTWFGWIMLIAAELVAITHMFKFEYPPELLAQAGYPSSTLSFAPNISPGVLILIFIPFILLFNLVPVKSFGQMEYIFGTTKMMFVCVMIVLNTVIHAWNRADKGHFWTYNQPYSFAAKNITLADGTIVNGGIAQLAGMWEAMTTSIFGLIGIETVAITAAENRDLRNAETVKIATRKISIRLIVLYALATFTVGLNVPYDYPTISDPSVISFGFAQNSAFVVSAVIARLPYWPMIINCFIIFSAMTAGINGCYNASRTLHAIASDRQAWPECVWVQCMRSRLERTRYGCPYVAVFVSWCFGWLAFMATSHGSAVYLGRMVRTVVISILIIYGVVAVTYLEFYKCVNQAAKGGDDSLDDKDDPEVRSQYDRNSPGYPYKSHGQWLRACYALTDISIFIFGFFVIAYQIKFHGFNPANWRRRVSRELQNPRPLVVKNDFRRGRLNLVDTYNLFTMGNLRAFSRWVWVWLK
ncbi:hypothetical protein Vi05172_g10864 [Venturia inaequalis]|nr:hypothetical protein Vi05172_g10864 [Venturia inaequalis]